MNLKEAKAHFINRHPLGNLTVKELKEKAKQENMYVYGDKAQILQCFTLSKYLNDLFELNRIKGVKK